MDLIELSKYLLDEKAAEKYLLEKGVIKTFSKCIRCESEKLGKIRRGKIKCYDCKYEWKQTKGSIVDEIGLSCGKFIALLKMFELEIPAYKLVKLLRLNEIKVNKAYNLFRNKFINEKINHYPLSKKIEFNIENIGGVISISRTNQFTNGSKLILIRKRDIKKNIQLKLEFKKDIKYKTALEIKLFLREVESKINRLRRIHYGNLYLYLKEVEFRFNNRGKDLFEKIVDQIICKN